MYDKTLDTFLIVAELGSFTKAAEKLYISHTAVIKQMNQLESNLDIKLFVRSKKGVFLTNIGEIFYDECLEYTAHTQRIIQKLHKLDKKQNKIINFGTSLLFPLDHFLKLWNKMDSKVDTYEISIIPFQDGPKFMNLLERKIDIMVGTYDDANFGNEIGTLPIGNYRFTITLPKHHKLASKSQLSLQDLHHYQLMIMRENTSPINDRIRRMILQNHKEIEIVDIDPQYSYETFNNVVKTNIPLLTHSAWSNIHPSLISIPLTENFLIPFGLFYNLNNNRAKNFIHSIEEYIK